MKKNLIASLTGPRPHDLLRRLVVAPEYASPPLSLWINNYENQVDEHWRQKLLTAESSSWARWNESEEDFHQLDITPQSDLVTFSVWNAFSTAEEALSIVLPLPFELASLGSLFSYRWLRDDLDVWGFGRSHVSHGWGALFRGAGHERLVSRRWLDFGPWLVRHLPDDTTFIQFYDLDITDPLEAYEQAKHGHQRMGNSAIGGYIQWHLEPLLEGASERLYFPDTRTLERVVPPGDVIEPREMLCNAALRLHHRLERRAGNPVATPVDHVAYIFTDRADAQAHLHELWLREMEVWFFDGKHKHRLDLDYHPVPTPPEWVKRLA